MIRIVRILKSLSFLKGPIWTVLGFGLIGVAVYVMIAAKDVTEMGIELILTGAALSGFNNETISHIRGSKSTTSNESNDSEKL